MTRSSASFLAALLSAICLSAVSSPVLASGGGEESPPEFNSPWGPVRPLNELVTGQLGVVEASWWRRPLLLAWYRFNGLNIPSGAVDVFGYLAAGNSNMDVFVSSHGWLTEAKAVAPELAPDEVLADAELPTGSTWDRFQNCPGDTWEQARRTLAERLKAWGANSPALRDWIAAQHRVFARCPLGPTYFLTDLPNGRQFNQEYVKQFILPDMSLPDPPPGSPALLAKDRAYQRAAALLYEGHYQEAESAFSDIAQDAASPWHDWGSYLALRARFRAVQLAIPSADLYDSCETLECIKARADKTAARQAESMRLRADIKTASDAAKDRGDADAQRRLADLDSLVGARLDPATRFRELAGELVHSDIDATAFRRKVSDYLLLHRQFPPSEPLGEWLSGLIDGYDPTGVLCAAMPSLDKPDRYSATPEQVRCLRRQWSEESLKRFQKQPMHYAWLFSAAALAERDDPHLDALLKALADVPDNHVGAANFMLHRLRLGARDDGLPLAAALLKRPDVQSDYSARNRVREYRLWHAASLADFWKDALREHGTAFDRDTLLRAAPADPKVEPAWGWDYDTAWILNYELPHGALIETARNTEVREPLRTVAASMAWSRAVLRQDVVAARQALAVAPPTAQIARLQAIEDDRTFLLEGGLMIDGVVRTGGTCHMSAPKADAYTPDYEEVVGNLKAHPGSFAKNMLSPEGYAEWQRERQVFEALPDLVSVWMQNVLAFADAFPEEARVPGLLRDAVYRTRMNWCAEPSAGQLSKQAFDLLKQKYPKSKEARTTKYWFKPRT